MIGSRSWFSLMRRNLIYRRRHWISSIFEMLLPCCFLWILIPIQNASHINDRTRNPEQPAVYPQDYQALIPFSYRDYMIAFQAKRVCTTKKDAMLEISGIHENGYNWQIPFIRCDSRKCQYLGQDAQDFCEYSIIAVTGSNRQDEGGRLRSIQFKQWMYDTYPVLYKRKAANETLGMPFDFDFVQLWSDPHEMDRYVQRPDYGTLGVPKLAMGIVFDGNTPNIYKYWLRQNSTGLNTPEQTVLGRKFIAQSTPPTDRLFDNFAKSDTSACPRDSEAANLGKYKNSCTGLYLYNGVIATQRLVGDFILSQTGAAAAGYSVSDGGVQFIQFPQHPYVASGFFASIQDTAPMLITLGLLFPFAALIGYIVREKELRQKEFMKMMSVLESDIGWSWFVSFAIFHLFTATWAAAVSVNLYAHSSALLLWIFWQLTMLSVVVFGMALSTTSSKATRAALIGLLVFFSGVFLTLAVDFKTGSALLIGLVSLHPVAAFTYGIKTIGYLEDLQLGLISSTLDYGDSIAGLSMMNVFQYLGIDILLWSFVAWYLNRVITPDYGQSLPLWFLIDPIYWCESMFSRKRTEHGLNKNEQDGATDDIPTEPVGDTLKRQAELGKSIEICNLRKDYGKKMAVDGLSLSMYSGQITALLGHNGAGKTTTISMLTGAIAPTSGYATVAGNDIRTKISKIRQDIGICLQHDCLFPQLTVREHVQFFARLKGLYSRVSRAEAERQIDQALIDVALSEKRHTLTQNLSGGMKRKLSVAIAFVGGSKVVLLDEPTSGMDPFSRRFTWNVIRHYRKDRCIILTTHFMDEADVLGDRIAIMAEGRLRCIGSSLFLKKRYGVGYQLTIDRGQVGIRGGRDEPDSIKEQVAVLSERLSAIESVFDEHKDSESESDSVVGKLMSAAHGKSLKCIVTDAIHDATLLSDVGSELSYQLPLNAAPAFAPMLAELDRQIEKGAISSYGVSMTTLNEVFELVTRGEAAAENAIASSRALSSGLNNKRAPSSQSVENDPDVASSFDADTDTTNVPLNSRHFIDLEQDGLFGRHVIALLKKRGSYFRRDRKAWICTTIVPSVFVLIGFTVFAFASPNRNMKPLTLSLNDENPIFKSNTITFNSPGSPFLCQPGICSHRQPYVSDDLTNEKYAFCGYEAKLGISEKGFTPTNMTCTISESAAIIEGIATGNVLAEEAVVSNVTEGSSFLLDHSKMYASSRYGAIWFSHFQDSTTVNNTLYNNTVIEQCKYVSPLVNYSAGCARFNGVGYVIQYNFTALHSALLYESLANEALVRYATSAPDFEVEITIAPLPITSKESKLGAGEDGLFAWFLVMLSFPFIGGAYASFVVHEKASKAKHLQTVAGVKPLAYWLSTFLWDTVNYQIPLWITVALMFAYNVTILTTSEHDVFTGILAILFLFGPALAGFTYCVSFSFKSASMCNSFVIISGFLIGMGGPLTCYILIILARDPKFPNPQLENVANLITWVLRCTPSFCLGKGIFYAINIDLFLSLESDYSLSAWSEPILLYEVYFLLGQCVVFLVLAIQLDNWSITPRAMSIWQKFITCVTLRWLWKCSKATQEYRAFASVPDDDDVILEQNLMLSGKTNNDLIVMKNLTKVYDDGKVAVDNLTLGIAPGECFGLLGINGAGKTTTMGLLTAEFPPTSGDAILGGFSVSNEPQKIRRRIGYCPQFCALYDKLTGREHLQLFGAIKGIPKAVLAEASANKLREVGLSERDWDRLSSEYSGGMKRRLSLACATIGQPKLIFLDECSTGVDPVSRREIWQLVSNMVAGHGLAQRDKPSVVLTTHSMDECEALCPRIGIMANGKLRCLGSAQHLKNKFGQGYQIELNVKIVERDDDDYTNVINKLERSRTRNGGIDVPCLNLEECTSALRNLAGNDSLSDILIDENSTGFILGKNATSPMGVSLDDLAIFAVGELRMQKLEQFVSDTFPEYVLRERQDTRARYEVKGNNLRVSRIFASIEESKDSLRLADYGVSQTSLEQVFNMHAAEAERHKQGRLDRLT